MSEYQCYEFLAIDAPLSAKQQGNLRAISTRAEITSTRFWNEYQWGGLKADPKALLVKYFDAHAYAANWGSRVLMLRVPASGIDRPRLKPYFSGFGARMENAGKHVVFEFWADEEEPDFDDSPLGSGLSEFIPLRQQLLQGDLRAAYLGWLAGVDRGADDAAREPSVPPGLDSLDGPLRALADLLGIDDSLISAAAEASPRQTFNMKAARHWLSEQSAATKDRLLLRAMQNPSHSVGAELLSDFRKAEGPPPRRPRTVAQLRDRAAALA